MIPPGWRIVPGCRETLFVGPTGYPTPPSDESALESLTVFLQRVKANHDEHESDDAGANLERKEHLDGLTGERTRATLFKGGQGKEIGPGAYRNYKLKGRRAK